MKKLNKVLIVAMSVLMSVTSASSAVLADNAKSSSSVKVEKVSKSSSKKLGGAVAHKKHYDVLIQYNNDTNHNWGLDLVFTDKKKAQDFVNGVYSEDVIDIKNVKVRQLTSRNLDDGVYLSNVKELMVLRQNVKSIQLLDN